MDEELELRLEAAEAVIGLLLAAAPKDQRASLTAHAERLRVPLASPKWEETAEGLRARRLDLRIYELLAANLDLPESP